MSVKRALHLEDKENTSPCKMPALERTFSPHTGTRLMSPTTELRGNYKASRKATTAGKAKTAIQKKLEELRHDVEKSAKSILTASQDLESQLTLEGSSELNRLFPRFSGDLLTELKKHKELVAKVESKFCHGSHK